MVIWCGNFDAKEDFLEGLDDQKIIRTFNYGFSLLNDLFNESNIIKAHLSNLSSPQGKLGLKKSWY